MTIQNIDVVIVDRTRKIDPALLHNAALSLNAQVTQHLPTVWAGINATVSAAPSVGALPPNAWPVFLVAHLPPGEGGFHMDRHNQPYSKVIATPADPTWTIDASHEILEMLVDPGGNRMHTSQAIAISGDGVVDTAGTFDYLVEACDPCEANDYAYEIGGIAVSDFITPNFYDSVIQPGVKYSYRGNLTRPRQMLKGGYISFINQQGIWQQILWVEPGPPQLKTLGVGAGARSWRESVHGAMGDVAGQAKHEQRHKAGGLPDLVARRVQANADCDREAFGKALEAKRGW